MIGFKINANGSYNFRWSDRGWTEGKLWVSYAVDQIAKRRNLPQGAGWVYDLDLEMLKTIEKQFENLSEIVFWNDIVSCELDLHLTVKGDMNFMYQFKSKKPRGQIAIEFLVLLCQIQIIPMRHKVDV